MITLEYKTYQSQVIDLISNHQTFQVCGVPTDEMLSVSSELEALVESQYLKCRVLTKNRLVSGLAGLLNPAWGVLSLASIAAHNLVTYDPDYEIERDIANNRISVLYKK